MAEPPSSQAPAAQRSSARQASRGTFKRMLAQRQEEEQEYAEFERAAEARMWHGYRPPPQPPVTPAAQGLGGCSVGADGVVVKKRRGRPPKPRPPEPPKPPVMGPRLDEALARVRAATDGSNWAPGTPVWVKVTGYCAWPGLMWSLDLCARFSWPEVISTFEKDKVLVRFYGDHSSSWVAPKQLLAWDEAEAQHKSEALTTWGKKNSKLRLVGATLDELSARSDHPDEEVSRMDRLGRQYQLDFLQAAARHRHSSLLRPHNSEQAGAAAAGDGAASVAAASAASAAAAAAAGGDDLPVTGNAWGTCDVCREEVPDMRCSSCHRWLHALCCLPAALSPREYPADQHWTCPCCSADNEAKVLPEEELLRQAAGQGVVAERMGLTPDWIIATTAFNVFQLPRPTADNPCIQGLLDPACNNKLEPNIPAEVLYDKQDDGLDPANTWKGYYVLLNPDYRAQVQWRFVNRAIDEVENGNVPAVLLVCRNSTDTAYFQRLRPYPRVLLRRCNTQFKDYDKCPIGFGVVVFCIATAAHRDCQLLYERFYKGFSPFGEPNIPIDTEFLSSNSFYELLSRLRVHAEQHARDHWVACSKCGVWRIITWQQQQALNSGDATDWTCAQLRPPLTSCATPQSKREINGMAVAADGPQHTGHPAAAAAAATPAGAGRRAPALPEPTAQAGVDGMEADGDLLLLSDRAGAEEAADIEAEAGTALLVEPAEEGAQRAGSTPEPAVDTARDTSPGTTSAPGSNSTPAAVAEGLSAAAPREKSCASQTALDPEPALLEWPHTDAAGDTPGQARAAAALLAVFASAATQLHTDIAAAYLCKSAAGQVTIQQAREVLAAAGAEVGSSTAAATPAGGVSYLQSQVGMLQQPPQPLTAVTVQQQEQQQQPAEEPMEVDGQQAGRCGSPVSVQDIREQLLQVAAGRQPQQPHLSHTRFEHAAVSTGLGAAAAGAVSCSLTSHVPSRLSAGLSVLAPVTLRLARDWMVHLVQQLLLEDGRGMEQHTQQLEEGEPLRQQQQNQAEAQPGCPASPMVGPAAPPQLIASCSEQQQQQQQQEDSGTEKQAPKAQSAALAEHPMQPPSGDQQAASPADAAIRLPAAQCSSALMQPAAGPEDMLAADSSEASCVPATSGSAAPDSPAAADTLQPPVPEQLQQPAAVVQPHVPLSPDTPSLRPQGSLLLPPASSGGPAHALGAPRLLLPWGLAAQQMGQAGTGPTLLPSHLRPQAAVGATPVSPAARLALGALMAAAAARTGADGAQLQPQMLLLQLVTRCRARSLAAATAAAAAPQHVGLALPGQSFNAAAAAGAQLPLPVTGGSMSPAAAAAAQGLMQPAAAATPAEVGVEGASAAASEVSVPFGQATSAASLGRGQLQGECKDTAAKAAAAEQGQAGVACSTDTPERSPAPGLAQDASCAVDAAVNSAQEPETPPAGTKAAATQVTVGSSAAGGARDWGSPPPARVPGAVGGQAALPAAAAAGDVPASMASNTDKAATSSSLLRSSAAGPEPGTPAGAGTAPAPAETAPITGHGAAGSDMGHGGSLGAAGPSAVVPATTGRVPPSCAHLRPRAVWALTDDPLLRAVLLEQPCHMAAVLGLLQQICSHLQQTSQQLQVQQQGPATLAAAELGGRGSCPAAAAPNSAAGADVDMDTLDALCSQPVLTGGGKWPQRPQAQQQQQQQEVADGVDGCEGDEYEGLDLVPDSTGEELEMMSSLELARAARMAANKAYMLGLGLGAQPATPATLMQQASPQALEPNHAAVIAAARKLAQQAAVQRAKRQLDASQRLLDARRRARRQQEKRLRATLEALCADEAAAAKQVTDALRTLQDVRQAAFGE